MARVVIEQVVSDLSGEAIPAGKAWTMTLTPPDGRRNPIRLDITEDEAQQWASNGTEVKRRGRRPGSTTSRRRAATAKTSAATRRRRTPASKPANGRRRQTSTKKTANGRRKRTGKTI